MNADRVAVVGDVVVLDARTAGLLLAAAKPMIDAYRRRREPLPAPLAEVIGILHSVAPRPADPEPAVDLQRPDARSEVDEAAWCSSTEAAIAIGVSVRQVRRLAAAGDLTARIVAGRLLVDVDDVGALAAQRRHAGRPGTSRDLVDDPT